MFKAKEIMDTELVPGDPCDTTGSEPTEDAVQISQEDIEQRVEERTAELTRVNEELRVEINARERAEQEVISLARFPSENPYPVFRVGADGTVVYANAAAEPLLDSLGSGVGNVLPAEWDKPNADALGSESKKQIDVEYEGKIFSFDVIPVSEANYVNWYGRDVTERRWAEEALRESEELHRITLNSISDAVLIADDSGAFSFVCPNAHVIFGYSEDEVAAKSVRELFGENLFDRGHLEAAGELTNIERTIRDKNGRDHMLLTTVKQVSIGRGTILYTCRDITDRKRTEDALAEERRLGELLLDSLPHPAMLIRRDRTILAVNKTARGAGAKVGGLCCQESGHADCIPEEDKPYLRQHAAPPPDGTRCTSCLADESLGCRGPTNNPQVHAFGRIWDTHWVPLDDSIYLHYAIDMTDHIRAETELQQSEILRAEAEKLAATGRMAARVAHEINNPLAGIKSAFQLIKKAVPKAHPHYDYVDQIEREINRIATIVRQMIGLHRAERETESAISVRQVVQEVVSMLDPVRLDNGVSVEMEMEDCPDKVSLPENALRQVLYNLLANGIEASPRDEAVRIQVVAEDGMLSIRIRDRGPGIPQDLRTRVFEPFFTTKNADTTGGLGLGLSISKGIVEAAGGALEFKSQPDHGCVFEVVLPIRRNR